MKGMGRSWSRYLRARSKELGVPVRTVSDIAARRAKGLHLPGDKWLNENGTLVTYIGTVTAWSAWDRASISGHVP